MKNQSQAGKRGSKSAAVSQVQNTPKPLRTSADTRAGDRPLGEKERGFQGLASMLQKLNSLPQKEFIIAGAVINLLCIFCDSYPKSKMPRLSEIRKSIAIVKAALPGLQIDRQSKGRIKTALRRAQSYLDNCKTAPACIGPLSCDRNDIERLALMLIDPVSRSVVGRRKSYEWPALADLYGKYSKQFRFPNLKIIDDPVTRSFEKSRPTSERRASVSHRYARWKAELVFAADVAKQTLFGGVKSPIADCNAGLCLN